MTSRQVCHHFSSLSCFEAWFVLWDKLSLSFMSASLVLFPFAPSLLPFPRYYIGYVPWMILISPFNDINTIVHFGNCAPANPHGPLVMEGSSSIPIILRLFDSWLSFDGPNREHNYFCCIRRNCMLLTDWNYSRIPLISLSLLSVGGAFSPRYWRLLGLLGWWNRSCSECSCARRHSGWRVRGFLSFLDIIHIEIDVSPGLAAFFYQWMWRYVAPSFCL